MKSQKDEEIYVANGFLEDQKQVSLQKSNEEFGKMGKD